MINKKIGIIIILTIFIFSSTGPSKAQSVDLKYETVDKNLKYKNMILIENLLNTGEISVNTNMGLTSYLDAEFNGVEDDLLIQLHFSKINLDLYNRELSILDKKARKVNLKGKNEVEKELQQKALNKWINLSINSKGMIKDKYYPPVLDKIKTFDIASTAEQLIIQFPEEEIQIGHQWKEDYKSTIPSFDKNQPIHGAIKYTYLGTKDHNSLLCHKIQVSLFLEEERKLGEGGKQGITRVSRMGSGTLYFAVDGNYLVESKVSSDLTLLSVTEESDGQKYRNFIRTKIDQNIYLLNNYQ